MLPILVPLAALGLLFLYLLLSDQLVSSVRAVPLERYRALEQNQRIAEIARRAERAMFEEALRAAKHP